MITQSSTIGSEAEWGGVALYTAVTRGKRLVVLVGSERAIRKAVDEADTSERWTGLGARLAASGP